MSKYAPAKIDPRGPRFGGAITTLVLAAAFLNPGTQLATALLILQTVVFGLGAIVGLWAQPYGWIYRKLVQPRLAPVKEWEDAAPPRFAQAVGLGFALAALLGVVLNLPVLTSVAVGLALVAAFLNAAFNFCLGCEMYLLARRLTAVRRPLATTAD